MHCPCFIFHTISLKNRSQNIIFQNSQASLIVPYNPIIPRRKTFRFVFCLESLDMLHAGLRLCLGLCHGGNFVRSSNFRSNTPFDAQKAKAAPTVRGPRIS